MTGPTPILEDLARDWQRIRHPHHHQPPAAAPATMAAAPAAATAPPQGDTMSVLNDLENFVTEAKAIGEDGFAKLKAIKANPETADLFEDLNGLASTVGIPPGFITGVGQALKVLRAAYQSDPAQVAAPVQPQAPQQPVPAAQ